MNSTKRVLSILLSLAMLLSITGIGVTASAKATQNPTILVSGLSGYSPDSYLSKVVGDYWGGLACKSMGKAMTAKGVPTYETEVGPFSSNWDRACELYANIKGGRVDYGAAHSAREGHDRYGRTYPGIYPQWDADHPVDLLAHSMGAPTIHIMTSLLAFGNADEQAAAPNDCSPLFTGGKGNWCHSASTVCGTNNGTTLADGIFNILDKLTGSDTSTGSSKSIEIAGALCGILGLATQGTDIGEVINADFDQWGFAPKAGETNIAYIQRCLDSKIWKSRDVCWYDMSTWGSKEIAEKFPESPDTYYYAIPARASTTKSATNPKQKHSDNAFILAPLYLILGNYQCDNTAWGTWKDEWYPNDGMVNTAFARAPFGSKQQDYSPTCVPEKGAWVNMPEIYVEHSGAVGFYLMINRTVDTPTYYTNHMRYVQSFE
ncbi:MAG: hypothetical protein IJ133_07895 [Clostridia bacterium]|nr:hypothetical protein [Clostridia bacterium]